jgi:hypothetical protein
MDPLGCLSRAQAPCFLSGGWFPSISHLDHGDVEHSRILPPSNRQTNYERSDGPAVQILPACGLAVDVLP